MNFLTTMTNTTPAPQQSATTELTQQSRGEFLRNLGLSGAALMAFYCIGTSSCKSSDPTPSSPTPTGNGVTGNASTSAGAISFTVDLTNSNYSILKTAGQTIKVGDVFIANTTNGYVALSRYCTHQGLDQLVYRQASNNIQCQAHGSVFNTSGAVVNGPAASALTRYTATASTDGNTLTVKA